MSLCANLSEKNTKRMAFKFIFSIAMMVVSLIVYPQASLTSPYESFLPPTKGGNISVYIVANSVSKAKKSIDEVKDEGIAIAIVMPDMTKLNATDVKEVVSYSSSKGIATGLSLGGTILSNEGYMSDAYKDDFTGVIDDLLNASVLDYIETLELLPYINVEESFGSESDAPSNLLFGATYDDAQFLSDLITQIGDEDVVTRTTVHMSYLTSYRTLLKRLGEIEGLDQVGVSIFQPHLNTIPTALASGVAQARQVTGKEIFVGQVGFSTHDDAHGTYMQDAWFWACLGVTTSYGAIELALWEWNDDPFPFPVQEAVEPQYGIKDKPVMESISDYLKEGKINYVGYTTNVLEISLGTFSTSGSTGVISGNIWFSLLARIVIGAIVGRKCKINGKLLAPIVFAFVIALHLSMGAVVSNSPMWWYAFPTYFYLYMGLSAGVFQIQVVSTIVRHKKVFDFCDTNDAKKCSLEFFQK